MAVLTVNDMDEIYNLAIVQLKPILTDLEAGCKFFAGEAVTLNAQQEENAKENINCILGQLKDKVSALDPYEIV